VLPLHPAKAEAGAKIEYGKQLNSLKAKRETVGQKLHEIKAAGEDAWESMTSGVDVPLPVCSSMFWTAIRHCRFVTMKRRNPGESSNRSCRSGVVKGCRWSISQPGSGGPNGDLYGAAHR
jgi:hypothetical protein